MEIDNIKVEMLTKEESITYLGEMITFHQQETTEIMNRIRPAWATFYKYNQELTSKSYLLAVPEWSQQRWRAYGDSHKR